jgi:hypothetical protein
MQLARDQHTRPACNPCIISRHIPHRRRSHTRVDDHIRVAMATARREDGGANEQPEPRREPALCCMVGSVQPHRLMVECAK